MLVPCGLFPDMEDNFQDGNSLGGDFDLVFRQIFFETILADMSGSGWLSQADQTGWSLRCVYPAISWPLWFKVFQLGIDTQS